MMASRGERRAMADWGVAWMIRLRWIAAFCLVAAPAVARLLNVRVSIGTFVALGGLVASYNAVLNIWVRRTGAVAEAGIHAQIVADLVAFAAVFHFSGGIENPLLSFYAFHVMIAAIVLSRRDSFVYATLAGSLIAAFALAERSGILAHRSLGAGWSAGRFDDRGFVAVIVLANAALLFIVAYLSSVIGDVLRRREADLIASNRSLDQQDRLKSQYVLLLAHSMMRRLEDVQQAVASAQRDLPPTGTEATRGMLVRARQWLGTLRQFMQDVIDLSRIRAAGTLATSYVYVPRIVYQQVQDLQALGEERHIRIAAELGAEIPPIKGDPQALGQAVQNVLRNAIVYGTPGSVVRVTLAVRDDMLELGVENDGIGIAAEDLPHIFEEFYRASRARELDPRGSGLGLSIAKHVVEQHGGSIQVSSEEGKGCRFLLRFPASERAAEVPPRVERLA